MRILALTVAATALLSASLATGAAPPGVPLEPPAAGARTQVQPSLVESAQSKVRPFSMERAEQWTLRTKAERSFEISVALPEGPPPETGYPVFYVLDPDTAFATLVETTRNQETLFGPSVIVGIGYPSAAEIANRRFDLTLPTDVTKLPPAGSQGWGPLGGADDFLEFIQHDLEPAIQARVHVDKSRQALFGHSLGGLFVLHVLFSHPDAFNVYIAGSPSVWWDDCQLLREVPAFIGKQRQDGHHRRLLITIGGLETSLAPEELRASVALGLPNPAANFATLNMVDNASELASRLKLLTAYGLDVEFVNFAGETHNSVIPAYLARGARFTLSGW